MDAEQKSQVLKWNDKQYLQMAEQSFSAVEAMEFFN